MLRLNYSHPSPCPPLSLLAHLITHLSPCPLITLPAHLLAHPSHCLSASLPACLLARRCPRCNKQILFFLRGSLCVHHQSALFLIVDTAAAPFLSRSVAAMFKSHALYGACHTEVADHFTATMNTIAYSTEWDSRSKYQDFTVLFGWDLEYLWLIAHQSRCYAFVWAGRAREAHKSYRYMTDE